ncbi:hypothetical protein ACFYY2_07130 [Streptomyces sp. NPDC001822]|uniref:hypothetical protein n=1 Tax=Streptomyces sp. NPDC001822 TaxID=3364614 RepID=UPI0036A6B8AC
MALSEKWEALTGPGTGDAGTGMTPASAAPPGGGGPEEQADLKVMHGPWTTASGVAGELHATSASALTELATASEGACAGTEGLTATTVLSEVLTSWQKRLTSVRTCPPASRSVPTGWTSIRAGTATTGTATPGV